MIDSGGYGFSSRNSSGGGGGGNTTTLLQYVVANSGVDVPIAGSSVFSSPELVGFGSIQVSSGVGFLVEGTQYSYDKIGGTITLLNRLLFNLNEVYNIFGIS